MARDCGQAGYQLSGLADRDRVPVKAQFLDDPLPAYRHVDADVRQASAGVFKPEADAGAGPGDGDGRDRVPGREPAQRADSCGQSCDRLRVVNSAATANSGVSRDGLPPRRAAQPTRRSP
jgi:hypothetical protein